MTKSFSFGTVKNFDHHIEVSVPNYKHIREMIQSISTYFITSGSVVNDIGCSSGSMIDLLDKYHHDRTVTYYGIEKEKNIVSQSLFTDNKKLILGDVQKIDLHKNSLTLMIFTLQFIPILHRREILKKIHDSIIDGGAMIFTDKVYQEIGLDQEIFTFSYYDMKKKEFSEKEIFDKQVSLRKIQKPVTIKENVKLLEEAGFRVVPFYQSLSFVGWICYV